MIAELKEKTKDLFKNKKVELVIGYQRAADGVHAAPCVIFDERQADKLIWDAYCVYNLSNYLKDFPLGKKAIVAKPCDIKAIVVLLQEHQLRRQDLFIIGMECPGVIVGERISLKCRACKSPKPLYYDILIEGREIKEAGLETEQDEYDSVRKLEAKSIEERLKFWQEEFSRCIRCYACRQICPLCYCPRCVADQTVPAYLPKETNLEGNFSWNMVRAMHLAGRCIDCGECERACPVGIPLRELNKKIAKDIKELFNYEAGFSIEQKPVLSCFDKNDPADFIR